MNSFNELLNEDLKNGLENEKKCIGLINKYLNIELKKDNDEFSTFDFNDNNNYVELKSRNSFSNSFKDYQIGYNKIKEAYKLLCKNKKVYFCYLFIDKLVITEITIDNINNIEIRKGGRNDRNKNEIKEECFIPNHFFKVISNICNVKVF